MCDIVTWWFLCYDLICTMYSKKWIVYFTRPHTNLQNENALLFHCPFILIFKIIQLSSLTLQWKIRKEAVLGLGHIFKKWYHSQDLTSADKQRLLWIRDKVLHMYYQPNIEDRYEMHAFLMINLFSKGPKKCSKLE